MCARRFYADILRRPGRSHVPMLARHRISVADARRSVATSMSQMPLESIFTSYIYPGDLLSWQLRRRAAGAASFSIYDLAPMITIAFTPSYICLLLLIRLSCASIDRVIFVHARSIQSAFAA
jgi:hypothetical protein